MEHNASEGKSTEPNLDNVESTDVRTEAMSYFMFKIGTFSYLKNFGHSSVGRHVIGCFSVLY